MAEIVRKTDPGSVYEIDMNSDVTKYFENLAKKNRELFDKYNIKAIDIMGSIGSGKTSLIENLVPRLKDKYKISVFAGDITTTIDADRIESKGGKVLEISTGGECHLDALMIAKALARIDLNNTDLLLIENVGNLICPASFPLGSHKRVVVISVTEGPYMVIKHPKMFIDADVVVINKIDLAEAMGVDPDKIAEDAVNMQPRVKVVKTNLKTGEGVDEVIKAIGL
ncbi:MAG: hydrogenase nickel incorporation protein HypB [Candidatus Aenigmarchaeota archaeon]|nr:hydrogenase nickel incorporation protein HypB [Candidatus Aenigmarchaeota archaeon]